MSEEVLDPELLLEEEGQELVTQPPTALFKTDDPVEVVEKATSVADALKAVIDSRGLTTSIQGKAHVRVEGWQLLGSMLGVTAVCVDTEVVDGGYKATVEARASDGRVIGRADALCTKHEKRGPWKSADDYARLSMAQTRATSKALKGPLGFVVSLAGYQTTPAEEMTFTEPDKPGDAPREGSDIPSEKQLGFLMKLLADLEVSSSNQELIRDWAALHLTGGRDGTCSRAIEALKSSGDKSQETRDWLIRTAGEWAATLTDLPADKEGL
jgi:hypothetical protein